MSSSPDFESTRNIEFALGELFHIPAPDPAFVDRLERRILKLERAEDHGARILQKIRRGFSSTGRSLAWMAGAVLLVVFIGWSVRRLIPAGDPLTPFPDTTISPTTDPTPTPTALPPSSLENHGQPYEVVFTIENEAPFSGRVGDPKPDWLGWGAQAFTVAPDGTFWIGDSTAEPPRLLHYSASGELLGAVP